MWSMEKSSTGATNKFTIPVAGMVSVVEPKGVEVRAFINGVHVPVHPFSVTLGDVVHFELIGCSDVDSSVTIEYAGTTSYIPVAAEISAYSAEGNIMTPADTVNLFANPNSGSGGAMGAGLGAGLLGGVLGGALLNGNSGGLFGGNNSGAGALTASNINTENAIAASERLLNARFDAQAQQAIATNIEKTAAAQLLATAMGNAALGVEIAKGQGEINTQNALNAAALGVQVQKTAGDTQTQLALAQAALAVQTEKVTAALGVQIAAESTAAALQTAQNKYDLSTQIGAEGAATRALIIAQNDQELNRRLVIQANEITELRGDQRLAERTRGIEITTTNNINQMQQQQQQQLQYDRLSGYIATLAQSIQATNQAINVGSGTQTASPQNTNTNIR